MTDSVESVLQKLVVDIKSHILGQYDWRFDVDAWLTSLLRSALEPMLAELHQANGALRKRIHHLEAHNQHFYRCESGWCNPSEKFGGNPAMETMKQIEQRAEAAGQALREAQAELAEWRRSETWKEWKALCGQNAESARKALKLHDDAKAENEKLRELIEIARKEWGSLTVPRPNGSVRRVRDGDTGTFMDWLVKYEAVLAPQQQALSPSPTPAQEPELTCSAAKRLVGEMIDLLQHSDYSFEGEADEKASTWLADAMYPKTEDRTAKPSPDSATPRRMMLPKNSAYPHYKETHLENSWCARAGCTPVCETAATTGKGEQG